MNLPPNDWRVFNYVFIAIQAIAVFFVSHFILSVQEPEGFFEIFTVDGFIPQFIIHLVLLTALVLLLNWINKREMELFYRTRERRIAIYFVQTVFVPVVLAFPFAYFYLWALGAEFDLNRYINDLWPFLLFFFLFINALLLLRYLMELFMFNGLRVGKEKVDNEKIGKEEPILLEVSFERLKRTVTLDEVGLCMKEGRTVQVHLADGKAYKSMESILQLKKKFENDPRYFATGSWIVRYDVIRAVEDGPSVRSKHLLLTFSTSIKLILPKERVNDFMRWMDENRY